MNPEAYTLASIAARGSDGTTGRPQPESHPELKHKVTHKHTLASLRQAIQKIERRNPSFVPSPHAPTQSVRHAQSLAPSWQFGSREADRRLSPPGLETSALHEVKPVRLGSGTADGDWSAALGFSLRLSVRRLHALAADGRSAKPWALWCWPKVLAGELGRPTAAGLIRLGLDPNRLIIVETARASETLLALEEALKSKSLSLVLGVLDDVALTPARRLSLAAAAGKTPCLLVTHAASPPAGATATRWRIKRAISGPHAFDPRAPGNPRFVIDLERCRSHHAHAGLPPLTLEWSDETHRFAVAAGLADHAFAAHGAGRRSAP